MTSKYELEKAIWTEFDFDIMGWHDAPVYGMALFSDSTTLTTELVFDLDYIFEWINPVPPDNCFSFWIAPSTLVFKNITDLAIQTDPKPPNTFDLKCWIFTDWKHFNRKIESPTGSGISSSATEILTSLPQGMSKSLR